ncbi:MAG: LamG domain-containing protein [Ignavibacteriae bacterium]|nr:MAG: LamG domain-containing protein [Ignavibacteriota bacterium]
MKNITIYLILLFTAVFLYSCKINVSDNGDDGGNNNNNNNEITMYDPFPNNGSIDVSLTPDLYWSVMSYGLNLTYDIYIDTLTPPSRVDGHAFTNSYHVTTPLKGSRTYYWQVKTFVNGNNYSSEVWRFTTIAGGSQSDSLIAYYPFNGNANDESGNNHNGQVNNASLTYDRFGSFNKAYNFNGSYSNILVTTSNPLNFVNKLTISAWVNFYSLANSGTLISKGLGSDGYRLYYNSITNTLDFQLGFSNSTQTTISVNTSFQVNQWYHVAATYNGSEMKVYWNGQLNNTVAAAGSINNNNENLLFGTGSSGYYHNGNLDDIRLFNMALSDSDIQLLYHEGGW